MAYTFPEDTYFSHINDILDGKGIIEGGGVSIKRISKKDKELFSKEVNNLKSILEKYHIREYEIEKYDRLAPADLSFDYNADIFVLMQLKNKVKRIGYKSSISNTLYEVGFTKTISDRVGNLLSESFGDLEAREESCYTWLQLVEIGIEYIFGLVYQNIAPDDASHYFEPLTREEDSWFQIHEYGCSKTTYYICNSSLKISYERGGSANKNTVHTNMVKNIKKLLSDLGNNDMLSSNKLLYHTTTWECTLSIMHKIRHSVGRECLDFGLLPGFYMGTRLKDTIEWGTKISKMNKNNDEIATILFLLPDKYPDDITYTKINGKEWEDIVTKSRKCQKKLPYQELDELEDIDLVYGDIACNPNGIIRHNELPQKCKNNKKQLVSKSDTADKFLQSKIIGIIFHKKA